MSTKTEHIEALKAEIAVALGYPADQPPIAVPPAEAAKVLGVQEATLAWWRSRRKAYLPYLKAGKLVRYRLTDLAEYLARNMEDGQ